MSTLPAPAQLRAAHVRRPHGVHGELRVQPLGGDARRFAPGLHLQTEDGRTLTVAAARDVADGDVLLRCEEVGDRDAAAALRDAYLCVAADDRRRLGDDEWFVMDLVGLRVRAVDGTVLGEVVDVESYVANDALVVRDTDGRVRRIPLVRAHVARVDTAAGVVEVIPWAEEPSS